MRLYIYVMTLILATAVQAFAGPRALKQGETYDVGDTVVTEEGTVLHLEMKIEDGHKGLVFKAMDEKGRAIALKLARDDSEYVMEGFKTEQERVDQIRDLGQPYAKIREMGSWYLTKDWIDGTRGDKWFKRWARAGANQQDPEFLALMNMYQSLAEQGSYVGNLKAINLIHDGHQWVIIDSSEGRKNLEYKDAMRKYESKFNKRWPVEKYGVPYITLPLARVVMPHATCHAALAM
jgi:hypothetical protein